MNREQHETIIPAAPGFKALTYLHGDTNTGCTIQAVVAWVVYDEDLRLALPIVAGPAIRDDSEWTAIESPDGSVTTDDDIFASRARWLRYAGAEWSQVQADIAADNAERAAEKAKAAANGNATAPAAQPDAG